MKLFTTNMGMLRDNLNHCLIGGMLSEGQFVDAFEKELKRRFGIHHLITVNSGTSALHLALLAAGVRPGDEVILSPQTFVASGLAILYCGAKPVFVDIDLANGSIKPSLIEQAITVKTKAILVVHWGGLPADLEEINKIAQRDNLKVIEDAAHAIGAHYKNIPIGNYSDFTCFSFQAIKNVTTGDGGAIAFTNPVYEGILKRLRWFGIDRQQDLPDETGERDYNLNEVGYKYHMNNLAAAIGLDSLTDWNRRSARRAKIREIYDAELKNITGIQFPFADYSYGHGNWLYTILVEKRNALIKHLKDNDIEASVVHQGITRNKLFKSEELRIQSEWDRHQINIPFHADLKDEDVQRVINTIKAGW